MTEAAVRAGSSVGTNVIPFPSGRPAAGVRRGAAGDGRAAAEPERAARGAAPCEEPLASLAHELRTPLASISNAVALLERALPPTADDETRLLVGMIGRESKRAARLLSDVLASTRPRPPRPVPTDLGQLVVEAVTVARAGRPDAEHVVVELAFEPGLPPARVDPDQLEQVLLNLIANGLDACLAARSGAAPRLTIRTAGGAGCTITVADTGPGLEPADLARIFEPFFTRKPGGTGLGLAVTRRIVEAHGGRVVVQSRPGEGSAFTVVLPASA